MSPEHRNIPDLALVDHPSPTDEMPIRTRLQYDFYPPELIKSVLPRNAGVNESALKGAITEFKYLPHTGVWFARAAIAPVVIHYALVPLVGFSSKINFNNEELAATKDLNSKLFIPTPRDFSHEAAGILSSVDLNSGNAASIQGLLKHRPGRTEADRQRSINIINALARRLAFATIDAADRFVVEEFDPHYPTPRIDSHGEIDIHENQYTANASYGRAIKL